MNNSIHRISLDIHDAGSQVSISAKKGDTARSLHITLTENGKPYRIAEGCYAVFTAIKPDKNYLFNDCTIKDNVIIYNFTEQTVPVVGQVRCEVILYDANNERITSPSFDIVVDDTVYNDEEIVSSDEATALISATAEAKAVTAEVEQKLANGDFVGEKGDKGDNADCDQTYNPESPNAQSGIAVEQAVNKPWQVIEDVVLEADTSTFLLTGEQISGFKEIHITALIIPRDKTVTNQSFYIGSTGFNSWSGSVNASSGKVYLIGDIYVTPSKNVFCHGSLSVYHWAPVGNNDYTAAGYHFLDNSREINYIADSYNNLRLSTGVEDGFGVGTKIKILGR